ncbi:glutamate synthase large subunit [Hyphococcus flavus]|uniref:Glutamate synthase [NADPH] large chain n=1 Tax=Hyphococcus flavus TaxID=1866326 RepID=A0AAE9ZAR4_9PROT|nr:glutamate synthase large subunit [Hyphococcus flavus]WDI30844.1 glutamate synthase large subunit [Hyphococcus flavus]
MTDCVSTYLRRRDLLTAANAYDPASEHDACGVGLVAALDAKPRREIVDMAIAALKAVWHRGAVDADGKTGDGAGIRLNVPQELFRAFVERTGHKAGKQDICVGMLFLPRTSLAAQDAARAIVESEILHRGFYIYGWRQVPVQARVLGSKANATRPDIEQILFCDPKGRSQDELDRILYIVRRRIEKRAREQGLHELYVCSLSSQDIIYKGMFLAQEIDNFYPDLQDERFISRVAIFHQRYSTNTFPEWRLAQPFRMLAHNGEINTLKGNVNWMKSHEIPMAAEVFGEDGESIKPVIQPGSSDSATLDQVFELLVRAGRSAPMAKALLIPEAWSKRASVMPEKWRALYEYCNAVMEPWDGPAAIAAFDGQWAIAGLDRNGLRPLRYAITEDGILAVGSETGMCPLEGRQVKERGSIAPGRMIAVDMKSAKFYSSAEILDELSEKHPYTEWLESIVELEPKIGPGPEERLYDGVELLRRQGSAGYDLESLDLILRPMVEDGKEAVGSMGDDTPIAVLSDNYRPLSHFFRQNFSQVTNPPIDPLREDGVMSLKTRFKNLGNILVTDETQTDVFVLESPILTNGMFERLRELLDQKVVEIDCTYNVKDVRDDGVALHAALTRIRREAAAAVKDGAGHIVLTDEHQGKARVAVPMILAAGGVHAHLTKVGVRSYCSLIVRSAECVDAHYAAVLVGVGATVVNPYLAFDSLAQAQANGRYGDITLGQAALNYKTALEAGLMKIISKMGVSVISAYRGGCSFEALGLSRTLVEEFFPGMTSRISGIGLAGLEKKTAELHAQSWESDAARLPVGGFYRHRRSGEHHIVEADLVHDLQLAVRNDDAAAFARYSAALKSQHPSQIRDLLRARPMGEAVGVDKVENANDIRRRFVTPGMSLGALSPEAHGALNVAMNRIGAKSVSGEGGEVPERYEPLPNGDNANSAIKQVASGRFGVTAEYLNQCREIEIKVAQGAKPGEGGQLPGFKVTEFIARMRHSTPGVMLISPPPHHDIYSIEDLAQLIYDLKQINPDARVCVKLVSASGIGAIAAGVAKAKADVILISGNVGGTGASAQSSIKYAGAPWELGLAEAHQVLTLNNLREQVTLRTDGGIRTGRDVVIAAMLGAEEYGIGTVSLLALGCLMVRQCHSNTCPVGVCTQDESLRERFTGLPEHVVHLMTFIAEETRQILADLGATSLEDIIGRADLLDQVSRGAQHLDDLDLNPILTLVDAGERPKRSKRTGRQDVVDTLDQRLAPELKPFYERREKVQLSFPIKNTDRAVGARISSQIVRTFKRKDLTEDHVTLRLKGSAGQSLGAFSAFGLKVIVDGDANDYVGKGLSGTALVVRPADTVAGENDAIIGNTCLYGATSGVLFAAGRAGGRFAVRNSGATAVIEGCSSNGCEYMTGGVAVILGTVGNNFAAGMTGGRAYVFDEDGSFEDKVNPESVALRGFMDGEDDFECHALIERHWSETKSAKARRLLDDWRNARAKFWVVEPLELIARQQKMDAAAKSA